MNQKNNISLILLTKNEEQNISKNFGWLDQVPIIDEIIVVDDNSTDNTVQALSKLGSPSRKIKISKHPLNNDFTAQRQLALSRTNNNWVLWLDADETPSDQMIKFLNNFDTNSNSDVAFKRHDIFLGKKLLFGETSSQYFIRLFDHKKGNFSGQVHERWKTKRSVILSRFPIIHYSHADLESFFHKINFYTDIRANELFSRGVETNLIQIILYPIGKFLDGYIFKQGFGDSTQGIILALCMSFHSFLVRAKLWHLWSTKS